MHTKIPCHSDEAVDVTAPTTTKSVAKPSKLFPYRTISVWTADVAKVLLEYEAGFRGRSDDIVVASFPKSGTTWTQAMVQLIMFGYVSRVNGLGLDVSDRWISTGRLPLDVVEGRPSPA
ncbi:hypothetical protein BV898_11200 [Hypsibius exemplaris]|uniref:Sulfotransferase domain-containing protein n=1 Tax=Hypsibius exemplaris TaxID=2072580 RepID=A0A1W0WH99_HYPEX|nr:hypothetical protein BV898_11200 [Hypsibius exemplaris]